MMNNGSELLTIWKFALNLFDLDWNKIASDPDGDYCKRIIDVVSMGRKKANIPELANVLPVRKKENEETMIAWSDEAQKALYISIKNDSISVLSEVEAMKKGPDESGQEFQRRRLSMQQNFMSKMQMLRQICLCKELPYLMQNARFPPPHSLPWNQSIHSSFAKWNRQQIFALLLSLRRSHLLLYKSARLLLIRYFMAAESLMIQPSPKMIYVYRQIQRLGPGDKMIVFSTFKVFLERVMTPWLDQIGIQCLLFCGGSRPKQQRVLDEFRKLAAIKVLLIVKSAGSEGLNMQFDANVCIIMDLHWNTAMDEQAAQRIDRIGQEKEVIIRKLYMEGSIDEAMRLMQHEKQQSINAWYGGEGVRTMVSHGLFLSKRDTVQ
jgi:SNF2 family DNA or RNA helicase